MLPGGKGRVPDRDPHLAGACRPVNRSRLDAKQSSHCLCESLDRRPLTRADIEYRSPDAGRRPGPTKGGDRIAYVCEIADLLAVAKNLDWLASAEDLISIRPKAPDDRKLTMTRPQLSLVRSVSQFLLPLAVVFVGFSVWWKRR